MRGTGYILGEKTYSRSCRETDGGNIDKPNK